MRDRDAAGGSRVTGKWSPERAGKEERVRGHRRARFPLNSASKETQTIIFLLLINMWIRSDLIGTSALSLQMSQSCTS